MAFPIQVSTNDTNAVATFENACINAGYVANAGTDVTGRLFDIATNLLTGVPSTTAGINAGTANSVTTLTKRVTAIADNTATTVLTITVPNVAAAALIRVDFLGIAGAGGAIGTCEDITSVSYNFSVARTPGVAMGAKASTAFGSAAAVVTGAGTMTCVSADPTLTGEGVTVTNTGLIKVTIDQSSTSTNHVCIVQATVINYLAGGVTIA